MHRNERSGSRRRHAVALDARLELRPLLTQRQQITHTVVRRVWAPALRSPACARIFRAYRQLSAGPRGNAEITYYDWQRNQRREEVRADCRHKVNC
jgi:hypothetical protein